MQNDRHKDVETVDLETLQIEWGEQPKVGQSSQGYIKDLVKMVQVLEHVQDGRLGPTVIANHPIKLRSPNIQPLNLPLNPPGPNARPFEKTVIDKIFRMKVMGSWGRHNQNGLHHCAWPKW